MLSDLTAQHNGLRPHRSPIIPILSLFASPHAKNGAIFQKQVKEWFQEHYEKLFEMEKKIPIGDPAKGHKFDIVDEAGTIAIECKRYTWTETGNVPSAKTMIRHIR